VDESLRLEVLRERTSAKWRYHPPEVIPAWIAEMDVRLAPPVAQALHAAIDRSDLGYRWPGELPQALAQFARDRWDWAVEPTMVTVIPDVIVGICEAIEVLTAPGEAVVITPPVYPPFFSSVARTQRTPHQVPMLAAPDGRYALDLAGLERAFARPEVTAFLLCSPHNPTGTVPTRAELIRIDQAARAHGVAVIADEIHAPLTLPPVAFTPYLSIADPEAVAVSLMSASKAWNLAGLKCAQLIVGSESMARRFEEGMAIEVTYGTGHLGVLASAVAYRDGVAWLDETLGMLADRAIELQGLLGQALPSVRYRPPEASYLAWLDCRDLGLGEDPAAAFLERGGVALSPGPEFGLPGSGFARLNFATTSELLGEIVRRMAASVLP